MAVLTRRAAPRRWTLALLAAALAAGPAACNSDEPTPAPPVPEPATAPELDVEPAGRVVSLPGRPEGLAFDAVTAMLVAGVDGGVAVLDAEGNRTQTVALGARPRHLSVAEDGGAVLVPLEGSDELVVVGLPGGEVRQRVKVGRQPHDAVGAAGRVFVGDEFSDTVSVIEGDAVQATVPGPVQPGGLAAASGFVAVVGVRGDHVQVLDASTLAQVAMLEAGVGPTHIVADEPFAYVSDTQGDALLVYRLGPRPARVGRAEISGAPYGLALDASRRRLWVTLTGTNELVEFSTEDGELKRRARYPSVRQPNSVAVDPRTGTVYVAGAADDRLQILSPDG